MNDNFTRDLVADWRAAEENCKRIEQRWKRVDLLMCLLVALVVVLLILRFSAVIPAILASASLAICGDQVLRIIRADRDRDEAWQTLTDEARLRRISPEQLVNDIENGTGSEAVTDR
jgi:hypothetical protein